MNRTPQLIRPPQVDDVWYVRVHREDCCLELDEVLVQEMTRDTVKLAFLSEPQGGTWRTARFRTTDVVWVELVRVMPRVVESPPCQTSPSDPSAPPSELKLLDKQLLSGRWPERPRTPK